MKARLIKIDKNGSKHFEELVKCDRCGGDGIYKWGAVINGVPQYAGVCYKCEGVGKVWTKWIERTPEYQAKLDAKREAKAAAKRAEEDRLWAEKKAEEERIAKQQEEERIAKEEAEKARKAISQWIGQVGDKVVIEATYDHSACFEVSSFRGYGKETMYIHAFKDADGNTIIWRTGKGLVVEDGRFFRAIEEGTKVQVKGTIKDHTEYDGEKQTVLTRCKVEDR